VLQPSSPRIGHNQADGRYSGTRVAHGPHIYAAPGVNRRCQCPTVLQGPGRATILSTGATPELQITLIVPYPDCPEWQLRLVTRLKAIGGVSVSVFGLEDQKGVRPSRFDIFSHWRAQHARLFAKNLESAGQRGYEEDAVELSVHESSFDQVFWKLDDLLLHSDHPSADVVLWLLRGSPPNRLLGKARHGVWSLSSVEAGATGFWELVEGVPVTTCELFTSQSKPARRRCIGRAFAKTDHVSLRRTVLRVRAINESLIVSKLDELRRDGEVNAQLPPAENRAATGRGRPGPFRLFAALCRLYGRYLVALAGRPFHRDQWQLAYRIGGDRFSPEGLLRLAPDDNGFWADPFVVRRDDRTVIFFEEFEASTCKGRIAAIEIMKDGTVGPITVVLDREQHLSYPFLFEHDGSLYMIPESADADCIEAFRCLEFPNRWESHAVLMEDVRAFDSTLVQHDGRWWMFATIQHNGNTSCDELHLFHAPGPFETWLPHRENPVSLDIRCARPAGEIFRHEGELFRPAQDCSLRYGYALSIQRILKLTVDEYQEETVRTILPDWADDLRGTHTVNQAAGVTVFDCFVRRRK